MTLTVATKSTDREQQNTQTSVGINSSDRLAFSGWIPSLPLYSGALPQFPSTIAVQPPSSNFPSGLSEGSFNSNCLFELPIGPPQDQGNTNGCGTTSLAMALNALRIRQGLVPIYTREIIDPGIRSYDMYSSPQLLARYAQQQGFYAQIANNGSFEEIREHLQRGHSLLAPHQTDPRGNGLHYVAIVGYIDDNDPSQRRLILRDPNGGERREVNYETFARDHWNNPTLGGIPTGMNRMMIVLSNQPDLEANREIPSQIEAANVLSTSANISAGLRDSGRSLIRLFRDLRTNQPNSETYQTFRESQAEAWRHIATNVSEGLQSCGRMISNGARRLWRSIF